MDQQVLEGVLGLWGYCLQFRRPMCSFLVFRQQSPEDSIGALKLSSGARNELGVLASLAPLCINDLHEVPDANLYCVDASPSGTGVCSASVGLDVARELWRRGEQQGCRIPMLSRLESVVLRGRETGAAWLGNSDSEQSDTPMRGESSRRRFDAASLLMSFLSWFRGMAGGCL